MVIHLSVTKVLVSLPTAQCDIFLQTEISLMCLSDVETDVIG